MHYLIDTNILIYKSKSMGHVRENFLKNANENFSVSVITYGELLFGIEKSANRDKNKLIVQQMMQYLSIIDINQNIIKIFAQNKAYLQSKGKSVDDMDLLIASTAIANDFTLITHNTKHFENIPDLKIEDWV